MTATPILLADWRLPGCGEACVARRHDPWCHELHGLLMATLTPPVRVIRTGPLVIDLDTRRVTVHGEETVLSRLEWEMLAYLAQRLGRWCSANDILQAVWGIGTERRIYVLEKDGERRSPELRMLACRRGVLRRKLGPAARLIVTVALSGVTGCRLEREEPVS